MVTPPPPIPMPDSSLRKAFPNVHLESPLAQLEAFPSSPTDGYMGEEADSHLAKTSLQVIVESDKFSPEPPLLQTEQSQLPQPLLIRLVFQTPHQLHCPSLDMLQGLHVFLLARGPKVSSVLEVQPNQG